MTSQPLDGVTPELTKLQQARHSEAVVFSSSVLTASELASRLNVPISWVRKNGHRIPGLIRLGKYVRWAAQAVEDFVVRGGFQSAETERPQAKSPTAVLSIASRRPSTRTRDAA